MDYKNLYFRAIEKYLKQDLEEGVYTEKHHIVPKHMLGGNEPSNLVRVTYRQHILLHLLLWKSFGFKQDKMAYKMMRGQTSTIDARLSLQRLAVSNPWCESTRQSVMEGRRNKWFNTPEFFAHQAKAGSAAGKLKRDKLMEKSENVLKGNRFPEWLSAKSNRSKYKFVSPEGLVFDSPIFASKYYGYDKPIDIENWCKRKQCGWNTIPELAKK